MPASASRNPILLLLLLSCTDKSASRPSNVPVIDQATSHEDAGANPVIPDAEDKKTTVDPQVFVDIESLNTDILLDIRYASKNNLVGRAVYRNRRCLLRAPVAQALVRVQLRLGRQGLRLLVWDCYRPFSVQEEFWRLLPNARYVAKPIRRDGKPWRGSKHNRGAAIDVSLVGEDGEAVAMPTDHDDFSEKAGRDAKGIPKAAAHNAKILEKAMQAEGFEGLASEWWHYDYRGWQEYALSEQEL